MKLEGRRIDQENIDDRRRMSRGTKAGMGIGGVILVGLITWMMGGNIGDVVQQVATQQMNNTTITNGYEPTAAEEEMANFAKIVFTSTTEVWTEIFNQMGRKYVPPALVLYTGQTDASGCGMASAATGPFYCSADQKVYIDLSFFDEMERSLGAGGDFAYAYVIAHEVGHHVQYLLGVLGQVHQMQQRVGEVESNHLNVRLELQADFYAGVWAYHEHRKYRSLESGDVEEGMNAASQIGDDRLQKKSRGTAVPDSFTHGTSEQRSRWLRKGLTTGDIRNGDTFSPDYRNL